jgi:cell shape-determining protein MreC
MLSILQTISAAVTQHPMAALLAVVSGVAYLFYRKAERAGRSAASAESELSLRQELTQYEIKKREAELAEKDYRNVVDKFRTKPDSGGDGEGK